jgi:hypothetical protein
MNDVNLLIELLEELLQEKESYIRNLRIADILKRLKIAIGA